MTMTKLDCLLDECLKIRDKRIMQLEAQIGAAADTIASRDITNDTPNSKLNAILEKVSMMTSSPSNIYINTCHTEQSKPSTGHFHCEECNISYYCKLDFERHTKTSHIPEPYSCELGTNKSTSENNSEEHSETIHEMRPSPCTVCGEMFESDNDLKTHTHSDHTPDSNKNL